MRTTRTNRLPIALALAGCALALAACPDDPTQSDDLDWLADAGAVGIQVDATSKDEWAYFSFARNEVIPPPADPKSSLDWDIAFQRNNIKTNGGASGAGQGAAADLGDLSLETTLRANVGAWVVDEVISDARTEQEVTANPVLSGWYEYHFGVHKLYSKYVLYAVRAADGRVALLKVYSYYDDVGSSGVYTITYRFPVPEGDGPIDDPDAGTNPDAGTGEVLEDVVVEEDGIVFGETNFDARQGWRYFSFDARGPVTVDDDPKTSDGWDLAFDKWLPMTNGGTSGSGQAAVQIASGAFDDATTAPTDGWVLDTIESIGSEQREESTSRPLAQWWDLDPSTQKITSKGETYWLRTAAGKFAKVEVLGYYHPVDGKAGFFRLRWAYRPDGERTF